MLRFAIRDLLWLMVVAGLGMALWIQRSEAAVLRKQRDRLQAAVTLAGYELQPNCWIGWHLVEVQR
jgi:hypothetical protein